MAASCQCTRNVRAATQAGQFIDKLQMFARPQKSPTVYILASKPNGTLYLVVTSNLHERIRTHIDGTFGGFTKKHDVKTLVYYEAHPTMADAIKRESQLKKWRRLWKIRLIEEMNPTWSNLFDEFDGLKSVGSGGQIAPNEKVNQMPDALGWPPARYVCRFATRP